MKKQRTSRYRGTYVLVSRGTDTATSKLGTKIQCKKKENFKKLKSKTPKLY